MSRALLVIDVQQEFFTGKLPVSYPRGSLHRITEAMDAARKNGVPVVVIQHTSLYPDSQTFQRWSNEWELHPEIARRPHDLHIEKNRPGSFTDTSLEGWLREKGIDTVAITGYMTQMCCDTTAKQALHLGFQVEFLSDATGTLSLGNAFGSIPAKELHRNILIIQSAFRSRVMTTAEWIKQLGAEATVQTK
ncbi:isochorismatase [Marinithermofilum abyssi]|uniref:Isochorismatase n=1 Tax=Marinithermofilum abyssi TaxID=1571185 RepID=A0A8J2VDV8_9BACL|nr:cysteine hydrolase family protein [Marinithermofilum abyssi]GGE03346.1 isochorismatase [Marinithermofilum abyssi]